MGGYGSWKLAKLYPERFAAVAPICGGGDPGQADRLKDIPIWVFHGAKDPVVPLSESERMVEALKAVGGNVRFTVYPDAEHDSWTQTYDNPELYEWFLQQRRGM
jgi:predicted peptidase